MSTWARIQDNNGNIRGIKDAVTGQRIVRWDGICDPLTDWGQRNARLVLAAPELLGALEDVIDSWQYGESTIEAKEQYEAAIATIAKARGEQ